MLLIAVIDQRVEVLDGLGPDVSASAAVTAVRAAILNELLAAKRDAAVSALARLNIDLGLVEKSHAAFFLPKFSRSRRTRWQ